MTMYQKMLKGIGILLVVLGVLMFALLAVAAVASTLILATVEGGADPALTVTLTSEVSDEALDTFKAILALLPLSFVEAILQCVVGLRAVRAAKHPAKVKSFCVVAIVFIVLEALVSAAFIVARYYDAASIAISATPVFLAVLCIVCARNVASGFAEGAVKDIAEIEGADYKEELGFIRVVQVLFFLNICFTLASCTMLISGNYTLTFDQVVTFINLIFDGVSFWLIFQRSKAARYWILGFSAFNILLGLIYGVVTGQFNPALQVGSSIFDIFLLLYFGFAKKPREVLNREFDIEYRKQLLVKAWDIWQPKTWGFWRNMIIYFCLFSIVGHWMEAGLCMFIKWGIVPGIYDPNSGIWRDYLSPFPVYGAGMVACGLLLYPIKTKLQEKLHGVWKPLLISFLVNSFVCAIIELTLGLISNQPVNGVYPLWDYSTMPFNFMGQICLQNTTAFGVVATLMTWAVWPALQRMSAKMPNDIRKVVFVAVIVFYALVCCLYLINL